MKVGNTVKIRNYRNPDKPLIGRVLRFDDKFVSVKIEPTPGVYQIHIADVEVINEDR